jgi:hypothetical protein
MNRHKATVATPPHGQVHDFMQHRLERALRERVRYRYVKPSVLRQGESFRVQSPCCSRNVDATGGLIDIALLEPVAAPADDEASKAPQRWRLCSRNHPGASWEPRYEDQQLDELLDLLCLDPDRLFWP